MFAIALIPKERQVHASLLIGRPDGVTWVDVAPWLARVTVERGDVTNVGVGGNDGVLQMLRFDLHNDGRMMPTWRDSLARDASFVVGDAGDVVGDKGDSASKLIYLLFGAQHRYERNSFSPHDKKSAWNLDANGQYAPLLWSYREVVLAVALTPKGQQPTVNDWMFLFEGFLGENTGVRQNGAIVSVQAKSKSKLLQDTLIETEQTYGSNDVDIPTEVVLQQIIDNNLGPNVVTIYCPKPSGSFVRPYIVKDKSVWDALQELAGKLGWFLGDRWDPVTKQHRLTFMEPPIDKDASTADWRFTWTSDFYVQELDLTDRHYRNVIIAEYWDEDLKAENRVVYPEELPEGVVRRAAKFGLGVTELIRTQSEALRFCKAAYHDLSDDTTLNRVTMPLFPQLDTFDGVVIDNPRVASEDMFFGVDTVRHTLDFSAQKFNTEFVGSGRIVGGRYKWKKMQTRPGAHEMTKPEDVGGGGTAMPKPELVMVEPGIKSLTVSVPRPPVHSARWGTTEVRVGGEVKASNRATRFVIDPLEVTPQTVQVRYVDIDEIPGPWSDPMTETPLEVPGGYEPDLTPPAAPNLGVLVPGAEYLGGNRYDVSVAVPFTVDERTVLVVFERREGTSGQWQEVGQANSSPWVDRGGLKTETTYQYRARAYTSEGVASSLSNQRQITIDSGAMLIHPDTPGNLLAVPLQKKVFLTWDAPPVPPPLGRYELQVDTRPKGASSWSGAWTVVRDDLTTTHYPHEDLDYNTEYRYRVRAWSLYDRESGWSNVAVAGQPKRASLSEDTAGNLLGSRVEPGTLPSDAFDQNLQTLRAKWDDAGEFIEALAVQEISPTEISQTVAEVFPNGATQQSTIQQHANMIAQRVMAIDENGQPLKDEQGNPIQGQIVLSMQGGKSVILLGANQTMVGKLRVTDDLTIESEDGHTKMVGDRIELRNAANELQGVIGNVQGLPYGTGVLPQEWAAWFAKGGIYLSDYPRLIRAGTIDANYGELTTVFPQAVVPAGKKWIFMFQPVGTFVRNDAQEWEYHAWEILKPVQSSYEPDPIPVFIPDGDSYEVPRYWYGGDLLYDSRPWIDIEAKQTYDQHWRQGYPGIMIEYPGDGRVILHNNSSGDIEVRYRIRPMASILNEGFALVADEQAFPQLTLTEGTWNNVETFYGVSTHIWSVGTNYSDMFRYKVSYVVIEVDA